MEVRIHPGRICLQISLWALVCGCGPAGPGHSGSPSLASSPDKRSGQLNADPKSTAAGNEIIFLSLTISQNQAGRTIRMENLVKKPGTLKSRSPALNPSGPALLCTLMAGTQVLDTLHLEHPLFTSAESINAQSQIVRQAVTLQQAGFFIRFQQKGAESMVITEKMPGMPEKELIRIKL